MSDVHLDDAVQSALQEVMEDEYPLLLDTFADDSRERLRSIRQAVARGDIVALRQETHSFRGSCSNMGALRLVELCSQLEASAMQRDMTRAGELFAEIEAEFATVLRLLGRAA
ncbi:Hpt domain protein [compost metagenome]